MGAKQVRSGLSRTSEAMEISSLVFFLEATGNHWKKLSVLSIRSDYFKIHVPRTHPKDFDIGGLS